MCKFSNSMYLAIFLKRIIYSLFGFMLSNLLHANCLFVFGAILLYRNGNLSAYVAALLVASLWGILSILRGVFSA